MGGAKLVLKDVKILLGSDYSIDIKEFTVGDGITIVEGPNGSGKSTIFRTALDLIDIKEGVINRSTTKMGYIPQDFRKIFFQWLTVEQQFKMFGLDCSDKEIAAWLKRFNITKADIAKRPAQLSGGQLQRLALIRECYIGSDILFLDEPFSAMDISSVPIAMKLLLERVAKGISLVLASHIILPSNELRNLTSASYNIVRDTDNSSALRPGILSLEAMAYL